MTEAQIDLSRDSTATAAAFAESDSQLFSTLCEIDKFNYFFLFERCKQCNVNGRQLRYFERDHIRDLIPKTHLGILAEFEYLLNEWKLNKGFIKPSFRVSLAKENEAKNLAKEGNNAEKPQMISKRTQTDTVVTHSIGINTLPIEVQGSPTSPLVLNEDKELLTVLTYADDSMNPAISSPMSGVEVNSFRDSDPHGDSFLLKEIIPGVLRKCQQNYKIKKLLTEGDRRLMASSIVDYFESRQIKLRPHVMDNLAEQIAQHFPTEGKKAWYHRENSKGRGRLYMRLYNSHRSKEIRHLNKKRRLMCRNVDTFTSGSPEEPGSTLLEDIETMENDEGGKHAQNWLKSHKCENFSEIVNMWEDTVKYRRLQMKHLNDLDGVRDFLDNWPAYKTERGHELLSLDFEHLYPKAMGTFRTRWLVYKQKIVNLLEAELKDNQCLELLGKYQLQKANLNEDSSSCALIYMIHAITKPFRVFKTATGNIRYCITDSQYSMTRLIQHPSEMDKYTEPYPCIFVVGDNLLDIRECYVVFLDIKYKLSYADCLVACMQLFTLLKLEDPLPSLHFWQFVRGYLFNIPRPNERPYAVMENVVSYLEMAAST